MERKGKYYKVRLWKAQYYIRVQNCNPSQRGIFYFFCLFCYIYIEREKLPKVAVAAADSNCRLRILLCSPVKVVKLA